MGHLGDRFQHFRNDAMLVYELTRWMTPTAIILQQLAVRVIFVGLRGYTWPRFLLAMGLGNDILRGRSGALGTHGPPRRRMGQQTGG
jgi:hypothetical protein